MMSPSRSRYSEDSPDVSPRYNRIFLQNSISRDIARRSTDRYKSTLVGSAASGVDIKGSDLDILIEPRNIKIYESSLIYREDLPCYARISNEGTTGPIPRVLLGDGKYMLADPVRSMSEEIFGEIKQFGQKSGFSKVGSIHIGGKNRSIDLVPQLRIGGIPQIVRSFATRERSWPSDDIISLISSGEFYLAARPAPSDPDRDHDFCLSFAKAEVVLLRIMSVNQIVTLKMLKLIGRVIDFGRGVLTSYQLKTTALWYFEKTDARFWENHWPLADILKRIDHYLHDRFLPHYFVPEMNLVSGVLESDLIYIRRRIWSLLGLCLITDDIAGITPHTRVDLAVSIFEYLGKQQSLYEQHPDLSLGYVSKIRNIIETAEVMYGTGIVSYNVMKQRLSASVTTRCPAHVVRRDYRETFKHMLTSFNSSVDLWMNFRQHNFVRYDDFVEFISVIVDSNKDTLGELFNTYCNIVQNKRGRNAVRRELRDSEILMNKWLSFTDDFINKSKPYGNIVADQVLLKARGDSLVSSNMFEENIDSLVNKINKELLTFAVGHIDTFGYPLDNDYRPIRPAPVSDFLANIQILNDVIDRLFLGVEYALVTNARIKASRGSGDQTGRIMRTMNQESIEYRCYLAYFALDNVKQGISKLCLCSDGFQGWVEFMAATFHQEQCS